MLTREEILALPAGAELDKLVAELVLGLSNVRQGWIELAYGDVIIWEENNDNHPRLRPALLHDEDRIVPSYSTGIAAAWLVVEALADRFDLDLRTKWRRVAAAGQPMQKVGIWGQFNRKGLIRGFVNPLAETAPLAICRAALLALHESAAAAPAIEKGKQS